MMRLLLASSLALAFALLSSPAAWASEKIFTEQKCTKCHSINAKGISHAKAEGAEAGEEAGASRDLSTVGKDHDAAFFMSYLKKESAHSAHADGSGSTKKHTIKFKGTDDELKQLADWLATLK